MQSPSSIEFDFNSGRASPCGSSPSTPKGFGDYYFSAPTTPARANKSIYREVDDLFHAGNNNNNYARGETSTSTLPYDYFSYQPKSPQYVDKFSNDDGAINPMKPPSYDEGASNNRVKTLKSPLLSSNSPKQHHKKSLWSAFSPKRKKDPSDDHYEITGHKRETRTKKQEKVQERGRSSTLSKTSRRSARSHSPVRKSKYPWEEEEQLQNSEAKQLSSKGSKKWRLKDLFLFRSASDGRAFDKDPLKKYSYFHRKQHEIARSTSTQKLSTEGSDNNNKVTVRKGPISAHELHYTVNKAMSQDMKKKSFLPYKQGILGRLAFSPTVHGLAHGFGSLA